MNKLRMIIATNGKPSLEEFKSLLSETLDELNSQAKTSKSISRLLGRDLEPHIKKVMDSKAIKTPFEGSIELVGGQKFPDIVAKKYFGVEVKSTNQDHWKTTGNSVLESTRIAGVERIFLLFGKLYEPIEFKCRPYEEVLSEVVVTHSPRYLIDMNLTRGGTIFDKIKISYDELRSLENPIKPIVKHYKAQLEPGEELWWIEDDSEKKPSNLTIRIWSNIPQSLRDGYKRKAMAFFPELFSNGSDKFGRFAVWLISSEGIVCPNVRDIFTAGGKGEVHVGRTTYQDVPRILITLVEDLEATISIVTNSNTDELSRFWKVGVNEREKVLIWINLVQSNVRTIADARHLNIRRLLSDRMAEVKAFRKWSV